MMHLTPQESLSTLAAAAAAWLMVRAAVGTKLMKERARKHCASCGRRLGRSGCDCRS